jgi:broad specificity phosphatase PhoE
MKLFLVRHGETEENVAGTLMGHLPGVLTEQGRKQARETAGALKGQNFAHIYSSDLARCVDTAVIIKESHPDTPLTFTKELRERNLGVLQGQVAKFVDWDGLSGDGDDKRPENGETVTELRARVQTFIEQVYSDHSNESILLVSHEGWIKRVVSLITGVPSTDVPKIENGRPIELEVNQEVFIL